MTLRRKLLLLLVVLLLSMVAFMLWQAKGSWTFLLPYRATKLFALMLVGTVIAASTIVFQTLTGNRILTPSIMGLDSLYLLIQIVSIALLGHLGYTQMDVRLNFAVNVGLMVLSAWLLFSVIASYVNRELFRLLLIGVIFGVLCRSVTNLFSRLLSPEDYAIFQGVAFAQFNNINKPLLGIATILCSVCLLIIWRHRHVLDIMALGRDTAISLGIEYQYVLKTLMMSIAVLVAVSTALAGPVIFFGLLVSALTYRLFPTPYHQFLLPAAALIAMLTLIVGQTIFERFLGFSATLSVAVEFLGGLVFIGLLLRKSKR